MKIRLLLCFQIFTNLGDAGVGAAPPGGRREPASWLQPTRPVLYIISSG